MVLTKIISKSIIKTIELPLKIKQGFKDQKFWCIFLRAPNNMFTYTIVHLILRAPQIIVCARMYTNVHLTMHLLQRQKYFREGKLKVSSAHHLPRTQSANPDCLDCFLQTKKNNRWVPCLPRTKTTGQLFVNSV